MPLLAAFVDKGGEGGGDYALVIFHDPGLCHIISEPVTGLDEGTHNIKGGDLLKVPPPFRSSATLLPPKGREEWESVCPGSQWRLLAPWMKNERTLQDPFSVVSLNSMNTGPSQEDLTGPPPVDDEDPAAAAAEAVERGEDDSAALEDKAPLGLPMGGTSVDFD